MKLQSTFARHDLTSEGEATELGLPFFISALYLSLEEAEKSKGFGKNYYLEFKCVDYFHFFDKRLKFKMEMEVM